MSAEEQERQRDEWKAELKKTEEEILTLRQVLTAKERHAAGAQLYTQHRETGHDTRPNAGKQKFIKTQ